MSRGLTELKKTTGELKDGMHSACAFLNIDNHHTHTNLNYNANTTIYSVAIGNKSHCGNFGFVGTICHRA